MRVNVGVENQRNVLRSPEELEVAKLNLLNFDLLLFISKEPVFLK